ncbi:hypothetical protein L581_0708 [Serratia fonticola AU-AP2C]|nr:hypothetical protein L581_0708 [Serratia fonticola AU-AP2C]
MNDFEIDVLGTTPVRVSIRTADYQPVTSFPLAEIPRRVDAGEFDEMPGVDADLVDCWLEETPHKTIEDGDMLLVWRWLVAAAFIREQRERNGTIPVEWRPGEWAVCAMYCGKYGSMNLHPAAERLAMANNIEGALIERYGTELGTKNAIEFYMGMRDESGGLTDLGRKVLSDLHDSFIEELNTEGLPPAPTAH